MYSPLLLPSALRVKIQYITVAQLLSFLKNLSFIPCKEGIIIVLGLWWKLNEIAHEKNLVQCLVYEKCSINVDDDTCSSEGERSC